MNQAAKSPAGERLKETLSKFLDDPAVIVQMLLRAHAVDASADYIMALEWAKEARDYNFVSKAAKEIWEMTDIVGSKKEEEKKTEIHVHLDSGSLQEAEVIADYDTIEIDDPEFD